jgi:phosphonate degradation associated HDIG domain protein
MKSVDEIIALYERHGSDFYSEDISQIDHAVQAANLALASGTSSDLVLASLLHDIGHLMHLDAMGADDSHFTQDLRHEKVGADELALQFPAAVIEPIRWHVAAKRWLCARDPEYAAALSEASKQSLHFQGGPMSATECAEFESHKWFKEAVQLRRWDDEAKVVGRDGDHLAQFRDVLRAHLA